MNVFVPGVLRTLTVLMGDGSVDLFPRALLYANGGLVGTLDLVHVSNGLYEVPWTPALTAVYSVVFVVYSDGSHTSLASGYNRVLEQWQPASQFLGTLEARTALIEKILRNRLELADGQSGNWVLYDDDNATPLLTWNVVSKSGGPIVQGAGSPSRRSRGV